ncbi:MAG: hypothetical protein IT242_11670 [Bacteroidia bacterium]|nr:hypothetical protein [Bacteroidia bacterium]
MKTFLTGIIVLFVYGSLKAGDPFNLKDGFSNDLSLFTAYSFSSNALTNEFSQAYFLSKFIDAGMKDRVSMKLTEDNSAGGFFTGGMMYQHRFPEDSSGNRVHWYAGLWIRNYLDIKFRKDAFEMYFRGNSSYSGKYAWMDGFHYDYITYQQFQFGMGKSRRKETGTISWTAGLAINKGESFSMISLPEANMYTDPTGLFLDVQLGLEIRQNDSSSTGLSALNGMGASFYGEWSWKNREGLEIQASVENAGFIYWNSESAYVQADTTFRFEGIDVSDLLNFGDSIKGNIDNDSSFVQGFLTNRRNDPYTSLLPCRIMLSCSRDIYQDWNLTIGLSQTLFTSARPLGFAEIARKFHHHRIGITASYGEYTFWNMGLNYTAEVAGKWEISAGSSFISAMLNTKSGRSQGAFVSLKKFF